MKIAKNEEIAYLAGIVDSDGCISLYESNRVIRPHISVVNTSPILINKIEEILELLDVKYYLHHRKRVRLKWKRCFAIVIQNKENAIKLLNALLPFLVMKKEQAKIVLTFCERKKTLYKYEEIDMFSLCEKIRILNKKGV